MISPWIVFHFFLFEFDCLNIVLWVQYFTRISLVFYFIISDNICFSSSIPYTTFKHTFCVHNFEPNFLYWAEVNETLFLWFSYSFLSVYSSFKPMDNRCRIVRLPFALFCGWLFWYDLAWVCWSMCLFLFGLCVIYFYGILSCYSWNCLLWPQYVWLIFLWSLAHSSS